MKDMIEQKFHTEVTNYLAGELTADREVARAVHWTWNWTLLDIVTNETSCEISEFSKWW